jgi:peptide-methionine (R)-S-oxide reductase
MLNNKLDNKLNRRTLGLAGAAFALSACTGNSTASEVPTGPMPDAQDMPEGGADNTTEANMSNEKWANLSESEWKDRLTAEEFDILRKEGTERSFSHEFNDVAPGGTFVCAGCALPLFEYETKFDSGTGWPSFYTHIDGAVETKKDFKLVFPRTEYHCARCGGHQGHVFKDGPEPTGLRYCNNGLALDYVEKA